MVQHKVWFTLHTLAGALTCVVHADCQLLQQLRTMVDACFLQSQSAAIGVKVCKGVWPAHSLLFLARAHILAPPQVRLLDHDGVVQWSSKPADDSQSGEQPAAVSMLITIAGTPGKQAPEVADHAEQPSPKDGAGKHPKRAAADAAKTRESDVHGLGTFLLQLYMSCPDCVPVVSGCGGGIRVAGEAGGEEGTQEGRRGSLIKATVLLNGSILVIAGELLTWGVLQSTLTGSWSACSRRRVCCCARLCAAQLANFLLCTSERKERSPQQLEQGVHLLCVLTCCACVASQADLTRNGNLPILLNALQPPADLRQVLEAACHEDPKQRATAAQLLAMPFCKSNHPTILTWDSDKPLRPASVPETVLLLPPLR